MLVRACSTLLSLLSVVFLFSTFSCGGAETRTEALEELRSVRARLRVYDGAPPVIPHPLKDSTYSRCLYCHEHGRELAGMTAPVTPHPEMTNCRQCHVEVKTDDLFSENDFEPYRITGRLPGKNPTGPPRMVHRLQMRERCEVCHMTDQAAAVLQPRHGERGDCLQCHVHVELPEKDFP